MNHIEGGWPKDINMNDPEATQRYRRKIEKDDAYIHAVMNLGHVSFYFQLSNHFSSLSQRCLVLPKTLCFSLVPAKIFGQGVF